MCGVGIPQHGPLSLYQIAGNNGRNGHLLQIVVAEVEVAEAVDGRFAVGFGGHTHIAHIQRLRQLLIAGGLLYAVAIGAVGQFVF